MTQLLIQTPTQEVKLQETELGDISPTSVLVRFLAAPINPLDLLVLAGTYPVKPKYEHNGSGVLGYDGIGEILQCGAGVRNLVPGDTVVPNTFGLGMFELQPVQGA